MQAQFISSELHPQAQCSCTLEIVLDFGSGDEVNGGLEVEVRREGDLASKFRSKFVAFCEAGVVGEKPQLAALPCVASAKAGEIAAGGVGAKGVGVAGDEGKSVGDALFGVGPGGKAHTLMVRFHSYNIIGTIAPIDGTSHEVAAAATMILHFSKSEKAIVLGAETEDILATRKVVVAPAVVEGDLKTHPRPLPGMEGSRYNIF